MENLNSQAGNTIQQSHCTKAESGTGLSTVTLFITPNFHQFLKDENDGSVLRKEMDVKLTPQHPEGIRYGKLWFERRLTDLLNCDPTKFEVVYDSSVIRTIGSHDITEFYFKIKDTSYGTTST